MARIDKASFELGIALAEMKNAYYFDDLAAFMKNEPTDGGEMYFGKLKPLFDKYGYETVKEAILKISKKEVKANE